MSAKVSVSLPEELFQRFEEKRRARRLARSAAVQHALSAWTAEPGERPGEWDWEFVEAYQRLPQSQEDLDAWVEAGLETWAPAVPPKRKARK